MAANEITREAAEKARTLPLAETDPAKDDALAAAESIKVEIQGRKDFFALRKHWSIAIIVWISILLTVNSGLAIGVGLAWLDFKAYQWFITAVTVETFLQVVGLGYVAARYLFSSNR